MFGLILVGETSSLRRASDEKCMKFCSFYSYTRYKSPRGSDFATFIEERFHGAPDKERRNRETRRSERNRLVVTDSSLRSRSGGGWEGVENSRRNTRDRVTPRRVVTVHRRRRRRRRKSRKVHDDDDTCVYPRCGAILDGRLWWGVSAARGRPRERQRQIYI